jgi:hypothetical protein
MAQRFENLPEEEQQKIRDKIHLQNILEDVADLEYQAYYLNTTVDELEDSLLNR